MKRLARHILNKASSSRTIAKQECMVLLGNLPLVVCSDSIETVSISGSYRLQEGGQGTLFQRYKKRCHALEKSFDEFFHMEKNENPRKHSEKMYIPHYVGGRSQPVYPPTKGYARAVLIIHKPWSQNRYPICEEENVIEEFEEFLREPACPMSVKISYERVKYRYLENLTRKEPVAKEMEETPTEDEDLCDLLSLISTFNVPKDSKEFAAYGLEVGLEYNWGSNVLEVSEVFCLLYYLFGYVSYCSLYYPSVGSKL